MCMHAANNNSRSGIRYWLFQKHCECTPIKPFYCHTGWKITLVSSCFIHVTELHYALVEGEALAVANTPDKAQFFVLGCSDLLIAVDHKPLLKVFGERSLEEITIARLLNLKKKPLRYRFRMVHISGVQHKVAVALSLHPCGPAEPALLVLQETTPPPLMTSCHMPSICLEYHGHHIGAGQTGPKQQGPPSWPLLLKLTSLISDISYHPLSRNTIRSVTSSTLVIA